VAKQKYNKPSNQAAPQVQPAEKSTAAAVAGNFLSKFRWLGIGIALLSGLIYANSISNDYSVDDSIVIQRNMFTQRGLAGLPGIFAYDTFYGFFRNKKSLVSGGRYRPLTVAMFAVETEFFAPVKKGPDGKPVLEPNDPVLQEEGIANVPLRELDPKITNVHVISHAINVLLYALLCWVLYHFLLLLLNPHKDAALLRENFIVFAATLLFATHPLHTEAVANIKGRDEIITLLGALLAAFWIIRTHYRPQKQWLYIGAAAFVYFLGLLSKESAVTYLAVIPMAFYFFTKADMKEIAIKTTPLLLSFLIFFGIRHSVLGEQGSLSGKTYELMNNPFLKLHSGVQFAPLVASTDPNAAGADVRIITNPVNSYIDVTSSEKTAMIMQTWGKYLQLLALPHPLTNDYYPREVNVIDMSDPYALISFLINLGFIILGLFGLLKKRLWSFGILYYYATFSIVSNVVFAIGTNMSERFMFMPSIGFCLVVAWALSKLAGKSDNLSFANFRMPLAIVGVIALLYSYKTYDRNKDWFDDYTLFTTDIAVSKNSAKLHNAVGGSLLDKAAADEQKANAEAMLIQDFAKRSERFAQIKAARMEVVKQALGNLKEALRIHPGYANAWLLLGNGYYFSEQYEAAIAAYNQVDIWRPEHQDLAQNMGVVWRDMGRYYGEKKQDNFAAIQALEKSISYNNKDSESWRLLGIAYGMTSNHQKAIEAFTKSLQLNPNNMGVWENLGIAYNISGQYGLAIENFDKAIVQYRKDYQNDPVNGKAPLLRILSLSLEAASKMGNQAKMNEYQQIANSTQ
jgi:tetratricopeptide (TPR) repeat protein